MEVVMKQTSRECWKCGAPLWFLAPPVQGWEYHCQQCQHLTAPAEDLRTQLGNIGEGALRVVASVPCQIDMVPRYRLGRGGFVTTEATDPPKPS